MPSVQTHAGTIHYEDTGGDGPVLLFGHGLFMDHRQWRKVIPLLPPDFRCVLPTLPLGAHKTSMSPDADLSLAGQARIVADVLDSLDLHEVTLVCSDWSGGQLLIAMDRTERIGRLVFASCEAFDNYPPGLAGKVAEYSARIPGALFPVINGLRLRPLRRLPMTFGWLSKNPVPDEIMDEWLRPAMTRSDIRRDLRRYTRDTPNGRRALIAATEHLPRFTRPVLVLWATEDRLMPLEHGRRLAEIFPDATLVEVDDSYTLISEDQPARFATELAAFVATPPRAGRPSAAHSPAAS
jgi:pimeloyl-ACP methyl ester carboxylesterase